MRSTRKPCCRVLKPLWATIPETASRLRGRIEAVLDYAKGPWPSIGREPRGMARPSGVDPAEAREAFKAHHAALPYHDVPAFIAKLRERKSIQTLALEFAILTAARSGEVLARVGANSTFTAKFGSFAPPA